MAGVTGAVLPAVGTRPDVPGDEGARDGSVQVAAVVTGGAVLAVPARVGPAAPAAPETIGRRTVLNDVHTDSVDMQQAAGELVLRTRVASPPVRVAPRTQHLGLDLSYAYDLAAGGMIVLVATAVFLGCWCAAPRHGLLARLRRPRRPAVAVAAPAGAE